MTDSTLAITADPLHWALSGSLLLLWLFASWRWLQKAPPTGDAHWLVIYASQTGQAQDLAQAAFERVSAALDRQGRFSRVVPANLVTAKALTLAEGLLFVIATTGDGEAPDNALKFEREVMTNALDLAGKKVALLALGDRRYEQFCSFGQRVSSWLKSSGSAMLAPPVLVDDHAPADLARWDRLLCEAGFPNLPQAGKATAQQWKIGRREQVAAASLTSEGLYHLVLQSEGVDKGQWQIGDLFELHTPCGHIRDYSIANRPGSDEMHLFVRRVLNKGQAGRGSGPLTDVNAASQIVRGRIRSHPSFRPPVGTGPLLAIGAGSGWAGLRPHVLQAMADRRPCWVVFGERADSENAALLAEMRGWHREGRLDHLDLALSAGGGPYVQHILAHQGAQLVQLLQNDGAVVLCGRLAMGQACLAELAHQLGQDWLDEVHRVGRLRHDFY